MIESANTRVVDMAKTMRSVYFKMCLGILLTALTSFVMVAYLPTVTTYMVQHAFTYILLFIAELGLVIYLGSKINELEPMKATLMFYVFSILNGLTLTPILLVYTGASIASAFFITSGMFAATSFWGFVTKRDLSGWGDFLFMGLIGIIFCLFVQFFFHNTMFEFLVTIASVIIFVGLTAYDTQKIKRLAADPCIEPENIATLGALDLYLDFINLFLDILKLIGKSK